MWGFQSIKDSVQSHAAGLMRNISDRIGVDYDSDKLSHADENLAPKDAMKNVVTPKSIPQFTLPPLLTYESPPTSPENNVPGSESTEHRSLLVCRKGSSELRPPHTVENGRFHSAKSDRNVLTPLKARLQEDTDSSVHKDIKQSLSRHQRSASGSLSTLSIKSLVRGTTGKKSDVPKYQSTETKFEDKMSMKGKEPSASREISDKKQRSEQPGLSLQHLLSTKAGISTLCESPNTRRKESLFLSEDLPQPPPIHCEQYTRSNPSKKPDDKLHGSRSRCRARIAKTPDTSPIGQSFAESISTVEAYHSDSDATVACHSDNVSNSPLIHKIRSHRLFGRSFTETDSNNSSSFSSPQGSPTPSPRKFQLRNHTRNIKLHDDGDTLQQRRLSLDKDSKILSASNSDGRLLMVSTDNRRRCASAQNVNNLNEDISCRHEPVQPSIRLCLTHLLQHKRLNVSILEGKNFTEGRTVYLKVTLLPRHERSHRTEPIKIQNSTPNIRERLTFDLVHEEDIPHMSLKISCKEKHSRIRHAVVVGECIVALCDINFKESHDLWVALKPFEEEETPHIQLSLCYDAMLGCLTLDVVAARNVPKGSLGRQPDCFVTLTEIQPSGKIAKKQTKVVHRTQDPVFQESFLFSLCTDAQTPDQLVIVATLYTKDRVRSSTEAQGSAKLGQLVDSWSGRSQWAQALANEGEPVTHWHTLLPTSS